MTVDWVRWVIFLCDDIDHYFDSMGMLIVERIERSVDDQVIFPVSDCMSDLVMSIDILLIVDARLVNMAMLIAVVLGSVVNVVAVGWADRLFP